MALERARALSLEGEQLIANKHYAVDSIRPKCHELQHLCNQLVVEVGQRKGLLNKSLELHGLLEAVGPQPRVPDGQPGCWSQVASSLRMGCGTVTDQTRAHTSLAGCLSYGPDGRVLTQSFVYRIHLQQPTISLKGPETHRVANSLHMAFPCVRMSPFQGSLLGALQPCASFQGVLSP